MQRQLGELGEFALGEAAQPEGERLEAPGADHVGGEGGDEAGGLAVIAGFEPVEDRAVGVALRLKIRSGPPVEGFEPFKVAGEVLEEKLAEEAVVAERSVAGTGDEQALLLKPFDAVF